MPLSRHRKCDSDVMKIKYRKCILFIILTSLPLCLLISCVQFENSLLTKMEDHEIVIVGMSFGKLPVIAENLNGDGAVVFSYDSEHYKVMIENEVLTVNGNCYLIPNRRDSIRIEDDLVKINGNIVSPKNENSHN